MTNEEITAVPNPIILPRDLAGPSLISTCQKLWKISEDEYIACGAGASQVLLNGKSLDLGNFNLYAVADQIRAEVRLPFVVASCDRLIHVMGMCSGCSVLGVCRSCSGSATVEVKFAMVPTRHAGVGNGAFLAL